MMEMVSKPSKRVVFKDKEIRFFEFDGKTWVSLLDIARCCGFTSGSYILDAVPFEVETKYVLAKSAKGQSPLVLIQQNCVYKVLDAKRKSRGSYKAKRATTSEFMRFVKNGWVPLDAKNESNATTNQAAFSEHRFPTIAKILYGLDDEIAAVEQMDASFFSKKSVLNVLRDIREDVRAVGGF